jgi:DNA replication protein DnaC
MSIPRRTVTDQAAVAAIEQGARMLRLPTIRDRFAEIAAAAEREQQSYLGFFAINPAVIGTLATCAWVKAGEPLCLIGDSGTGQSHLLIGLGTLAAEAGYRVRYTLASKLVNELVEAADDAQLSKLITGSMAKSMPSQKSLPSIRCPTSSDSGSS